MIRDVNEGLKIAKVLIKRYVIATIVGNVGTIYLFHWQKEILLFCLEEGMVNMASENKSLELNEDLLEETIDFNELEERLQRQLEENLEDLEYLIDEKQKVGNFEHLGTVVTNVVWEQFLNQIAVVAGAEFIEENRGLPLDLSKSAHIQTTEDFVQGKLATHNTSIDFQERYDQFQDSFKKDHKGNPIMYQTRSGELEQTLTREARKPFDKGRPRGSAKSHTDIDHVISAAEILRDPSANAHLTKEERIEFVNSGENLNVMPASWNRSKGDKPVQAWLNYPNSKGKKPREIFPDMNAEKEAELREKDDKARKEYENKKEAGQERSIATGKQSRRQEAFRIGGKALRAAVMQLLLELLKEVMRKVVTWFKSSEKTISSLMDILKEAIHSFVGNLKSHLIHTGEIILTTIASAIIGPVVSLIKKAWTLLKQGWKTLIDAVTYIGNPVNKGKPFDLLIMEVGKIVIAGLTGVGAIALGEVIEKGLSTIPILTVQIPLLGTMANILGIFFGAVTAGIIGAIALHLIQKQIERQLKNRLQEEQIDRGNAVLGLQHRIQIINEVKLQNTKFKMATQIQKRHRELQEIEADLDKGQSCIKESFREITNSGNELDRMLDEWKDE